MRVPLFRGFATAVTASSRLCRASCWPPTPVCYDDERGGGGKFLNPSFATDTYVFCACGKAHVTGGKKMPPCSNLRNAGGRVGRKETDLFSHKSRTKNYVAVDGKNLKEQNEKSSFKYRRHRKIQTTFRSDKSLFTKHRIVSRFTMSKQTTPTLGGLLQGVFSRPHQREPTSKATGGCKISTGAGFSEKRKSKQSINCGQLLGLDGGGQPNEMRRGGLQRCTVGCAAEFQKGAARRARM